MSVRNLVENKNKLDYKELISALVKEFGISGQLYWEAVIPPAKQQEVFGGEVLRLFADHPTFADHKEIKTLALKKTETTQLLLLFARLKDERFNRTNIERITKKFLGGPEAGRYLVWFFGNKNDTALKVTISGKEGKKVVIKSLTFQVNEPYYKTYDYILGEIKKRTEVTREPEELWQALWKAFDISVVNKRFYQDIKKSFDSLINDKVFQSGIRNEEARKQFTIRLIGRIIFCWFLKKKGIISEEVLSSAAVIKYGNYYWELLEKLFFEVFNTPLEKRGALPEVIINYPFLNGGLFEEQTGDFGDFKNKVVISNDWFSNLFGGTLEKYNFTIDENTSSNSEIAIDPEMLGRIFENLLAEQTEETKESARKATGSYYTPREIVDYMVEQSIAEYLKTNIRPFATNLTDDDLDSFIDDFVHTTELPQKLEGYKEQLLEKLNSVKVFDPACGSGAFPIGMLQKLVSLKAPLSLPRRGAGGEVASNYKLKLDTILNSIYGADIQPMAVELSRLRCWLSLIIDEEVNKNKKNWGVENLPNLDFKFVCVDSLKILPPMQQDSLGTSADDFNKLKSLRTDFFTASAEEKRRIEKEFILLQTKIAEKHRDWSTKNTVAISMLTAWNPFKMEITPWFDPFWMFGVKNGFDIAIGNPPYKVSTDTNYKKLYSESIFGRPNMYGFFIHRCIESLLNSTGILIFINPKTILTDSYFSALRFFLLKRSSILSVLNFADRRNVFESVLQACIVNAFVKKKYTDFIRTKSIDSKQQIFTDDFIRPKIEQVVVNRPKPIFIISDKIEKYKILERLFSFPTFENEGILFTTGKIQWDLYKKYLSPTPMTDAIRLIWAENIQRYYFKEAEQRADKIYLNYPEIIAKYQPIKKATIFVQRTTAIEQEYRIIANIIDDNKFAYNLLSENNTSYLASCPKSVQIEYILALLLSRLFDFLFRHINSNTHVSSGELNSLPLLTPKMEIQSLIKYIVKVIIYLKSDKAKQVSNYFTNAIISNFFEKILDGIIIELFFREHMLEREINIIDSVYTDINRIRTTEDTVINSIVINDLFTFWNERDNKVRNKLMLFTSRSGDLIKQIYEHKL